jgi:hypothetical protein
MSKVTVIHKFTKVPASQGVVVIDACINTPGGEWAGINPFLIGPCAMYDGHTAMVMENAWQYSKVYKEHADQHGNPTDRYWQWARAGWANPTSVRYPMGRGRAPLYCLWEGDRLGYVESRKRIYGPLFVRAAQQTESYARLREIHEECEHLYIRDWDGWNMQRHGMTSLTQIINQTRRKMGHGFFLKAMLDNDPVLDVCDM